MFDINKFGKYREGLTIEEIKKYLILRNVETPVIKNINDLPLLFELYDKIAGVNTAACKKIKGKLVILHYRWDVKRYADVLFLKKQTYWD